jgi:hypothetical protein
MLGSATPAAGRFNPDDKGRENKTCLSFMEKNQNGYSSYQ